MEIIPSILTSPVYKCILVTLVQLRAAAVLAKIYIRVCCTRNVERGVIEGEFWQLLVTGYYRLSRRIVPQWPIVANGLEIYCKIGLSISRVARRCVERWTLGCGDTRVTDRNFLFLAVSIFFLTPPFQPFNIVSNLNSTWRFVSNLEILINSNRCKLIELIWK